MQTCNLSRSLWLSPSVSSFIFWSWPNPQELYIGLRLTSYGVFWVWGWMCLLDFFGLAMLGPKANAKIWQIMRIIWSHHWSNCFLNDEQKGLSQTYFVCLTVVLLEIEMVQSRKIDKTVGNQKKRGKTADSHDLFHLFLCCIRMEKLFSKLTSKHGWLWLCLSWRSKEDEWEAFCAGMGPKRSITRRSSWHAWHQSAHSGVSAGALTFSQQTFSPSCCLCLSWQNPSFIQRYIRLL